MILFGSFDAWVEREVLPGMLDRRDMVAVVAALRAWEADGTWGHALYTSILSSAPAFELASALPPFL